MAHLPPPDPRHDLAPEPAGAAPVKEALQYETLVLPLTAALCRAGIAGLSMGTPGHRGGRFFGAWETRGQPTRQ